MGLLTDFCEFSCLQKRKISNVVMNRIFMYLGILLIYYIIGFAGFFGFGDAFIEKYAPHISCNMEETYQVIDAMKEFEDSKTKNEIAKPDQEWESRQASVDAKIEYAVKGAYSSCRSAQFIWGISFGLFVLFLLKMFISMGMGTCSWKATKSLWPIKLVLPGLVFWLGLYLNFFQQWAIFSSYFSLIYMAFQTILMNHLFWELGGEFRAKSRSNTSLWNGYILVSLFFLAGAVIFIVINMYYNLVSWPTAYVQGANMVGVAVGVLFTLVTCRRKFPPLKLSANPTAEEKELAEKERERRTNLEKKNSSTLLTSALYAFYISFYCYGGVSAIVTYGGPASKKPKNRRHTRADKAYTGLSDFKDGGGMPEVIGILIFSLFEILCIFLTLMGSKALGIRHRKRLPTQEEIERFEGKDMEKEDNKAQEDGTPPKPKTKTVKESSETWDPNEQLPNNPAQFQRELASKSKSMDEKIKAFQLESEIREYRTFKHTFIMAFFLAANSYILSALTNWGVIATPKGVYVSQSYLMGCIPRFFVWGFSGLQFLWYILAPWLCRPCEKKTRNHNPEGGSLDIKVGTENLFRNQENRQVAPMAPMRKPVLNKHSSSLGSSIASISEEKEKNNHKEENLSQLEDDNPQLKRASQAKSSCSPELFKKKPISTIRLPPLNR